MSYGMHPRSNTEGIHSSDSVQSSSGGVGRSGSEEVFDDVDNNSEGMEILLPSGQPVPSVQTYHFEPRR